MRISLLLVVLFAAYSGYAQDALSLLFAGDIMQHQSQINAAQCGDTYEYGECFSMVKDRIAAADVAIANLEVTLAGKPYSGYPQFSAPDELAQALGNAGFDVLVTANNHSCDKGEKGIRRTIRMLDTLGIGHTGTFCSPAERDSLYPLMIEKNNFRLAILNYTYGTNGIPVPPPAIVNLIDTVQIAADIVAAKAQSPDVIIALMHWGEEYQQQPSGQQKMLADFLIRQGVRLVIGSHPHVLQRMERRYNADSTAQGVVVYSLGNFISNQSAKNTGGGAMAHIRLLKNGSEITIDECSYQLVWMYKPVTGKQRRFYVTPVGELENNPAFFANEADFFKMNNFAKNMRELFNKENSGFPEAVTITGQ
ncbi:MAG: CapA family protein [Prevotellaceae bacterium]|jgi:poly-gamma-glutamate synthesis protein (capsule biosynthesis protein)|nr:CapA family protein [Prevotellaceae bacterium]